MSGKLGIDATAKLPEEGARPWPEEIEMAPEVKDLVDRRWSEYGLSPARTRPDQVESRVSRRRG